MFCPKCKALIIRKKVPNGIIECCHCPGKTEYDQLQHYSIKSTSPKNSQQTKSPVLSTLPSSNIEPKHSRSRKKIGLSVESIHIPKNNQSISEYSALSLEARIYLSKARLPPKWDQGRVGELIQSTIVSTYERFYRKYEDFFVEKNSELRFFVLMVPNATITEFNVNLWGIGTLEKNNEQDYGLLIWYQGNHLHLDWSGKIRESEGNYIAPYRLFPEIYHSYEFMRINYLSQQEWFDKMYQQWLEFKKLYPTRTFRTPTLKELYSLWKKSLN